MGHWNFTGRVVDRLTSLWNTIAHALARDARPQSPAKQQLSNAEYHLTLAELSRLVDAANSPRDRVLLRLLVETGVRRSEAAALRAADVDAARNLIVIRHAKGNKSRLVPMHPSLTGALLALAGSAGGCVFRSRHGGQLSSRQINRIVARTGERAGVRNPNPNNKAVTCHLLRHSFARHWKQARGSVESLSKILGHASVKTTWDLYGTESLIEVQRNYDATTRLIFPQSPSTTATRQNRRGGHHVRKNQ